MVDRAAATTPSGWRRDRYAWLIAGVLPVLGGLLFQSAGRDDSYITYWAAHALVNFGEIVNYSGDRIEQSSSLLHTLVLAAISWVTRADVPFVGFVLGIVAGAAVSVLAYRVARELSPRAAVIAGLLSSTATYLVYWSFGGLETSLAALLLLLALFAGYRFIVASRPLRAGFAAAFAVALFTMVRPEGGPILGFAFGGATAWWLVWPPDGVQRRTAVTRGILLGASTVVAFLTLIAFRLAYFGQRFPQPVISKVDGLDLSGGLEYFANHAAHVAPILVMLLAAWGAVQRLRCRDPLATLLLTGAGASLGFVLLAGGDWMEGGRMLAPVVPLVSILAATAVVALPRAPLIAAVLVALQMVHLLMFTASSSTGTPFGADVVIRSEARPAQGAPAYERLNRIHMRDLLLQDGFVDVVNRLAEARDEPVTIASGQAGMLSYQVFQEVYGRAEFIDIKGLASDTFGTFGACKKGLVRSDVQTVMTLRYWFSHTEQCGVPLPDVVFNLGDVQKLTSFDGGYTEVHSVKGTIVTSSSLLPGSTVGAGQYVAVRNDLLPLLDDHAR